MSFRFIIQKKCHYRIFEDSNGRDDEVSVNLLFEKCNGPLKIKSAKITYRTELISVFLGKSERRGHV